MLSRFQQFIHENKLLRADSKALLAVSGGADSVVMVHLFHRAGIPFAIAHCNFALRGEESDAEQLFVKKLAADLGVEFYTWKFDTLDFARNGNFSVQEAARHLRYSWFSELSKQNKLSPVCTAHHADDSAETFFINLIRGTGISGLTGIPVRNGEVVRPLLFSTKEEILGYAQSEGIEFCEDSSNAGDKYLRNRIRHTLIPLLTELSPAFPNTLREDMRRLNDTKKALDDLLQQQRDLLMKPDGDNVFILRKDLKALQPLHFYLFEYLKPFGFNENTAVNLAELLEKNIPSGKTFQSPVYDLFVERDRILICPKMKPGIKSETELSLPKADAIYEMPFPFSTLVFNCPASYKPGPDLSSAFLDADKLRFPLLLRKWKAGDRFQPFGMKGSKLLSDYFSDAKFSKSMKDNAWVLESGGQIAWLVGHRIDERFRLDATSREVFCTRVG